MTTQLCMELEPDPHEWLIQKKWSQVYEDQIRPALDLLTASGCLDKVVLFWINKNMYDDARQFNIDSQNSDLNNESHKSRTLLPILNSYWAPKLESLFLKSQRLLDSVTCNYIIIKDKSLALELYYRIKGNETSFASVIKEYGTIKNNKKKFGMVVDKPTNDLPHGLHKVIATMNSGQIMPPLRINDEFCIVQLVDLKRPVLDEDTKDKLLFLAYDEWLASIKKLALTHS